MTPLLLASLVRCQVNQEIYSETDLLAIDSEIQEVREPGAASIATNRDGVEVDEFGLPKIPMPNN